MNFIAGTALLAAVVIAGMQFDGSRDKDGRGFLGRLEAGTMNASDRTFLKLEAICMGVAVLAFMLFGS